MQKLGMNNRDFAKYLDGLAQSHMVQTRVSVLNKNEKEIAELTTDSRTFVLGGEVQIDQTADVSRSLSLELLDPHGLAAFDPNTPSSTSLFMDRFLKVYREDYIDSLDQWVSAPIFHGPITKIEQDGVNISVEAMGKEHLLQEPHLYWRTRTFRKGTRLTKVIRTLLEDKGEAFIDLPNRDDTLKKPITVIGTDVPWKVIVRLAGMLNCFAFYDGDGVFRLRPKAKNPSYTFTDGEDGVLLTTPRQPFDFTGVRNLIQVKGPKPDQKDAKRLVVTKKLNPEAGLSAQSLSRNGKPRYMVTVVEVDPLKERKKGTRMATDLLAGTSRLGTEMEFESLVIPVLDEGDICRVNSEDLNTNFGLKKMTVPVGAADSMSIGFNKKTRVRRIRRRRPHR